MPDFLRRLFSADGFMPHGHCYLWQPEIVWLHVASDALVALSYTTIPFTLFYFARKRRDIPFNWMFVCFALFIVACGATHYMEIWTLWTPTYWLSGVIKAITAAASVPTAILLVKLVPRALAIPTPRQLQEAHEELRKAHDVLEMRVAERTADLVRANEELASEVAERKRSEAAVRQEASRAAAIMEAAFDAIIVTDESGRIVGTNPAAARTFGFLRDEVVGRSLVEVIGPPALRRRYLEGLDAGAEDEAIGRRVEITAMRNDGSEFPAEVALVRTRSQGEVVFVWYLRDITERRQAAEAAMHRRAKEAAESANAELEAFSYSVAHDLRAPLRAISGFSSLLVEDYADGLDATAKEHLGRITSGAERMGQLIDALLALAQLSRTEPRREPVDLSELARRVVDELRSNQPARHVDFVAEDGLVARVDPRLAHALLTNLLGNAWKFTGKVDAPRITFGVESVAGRSSYFVRDNGAGFDMAHAAQLFAPFRRLHTADEFEGTGIGLATVQRIVHRHGGRIWAEGTKAVGATFHFTLLPDEPSRAAAGWASI